MVKSFELICVEHIEEFFVGTIFLFNSTNFTQHPRGLTASDLSSPKYDVVNKNIPSAGYCIPRLHTGNLLPRLISLT